jgi:hypothetical protein
VSECDNVSDQSARVRPQESSIEVTRYEKKQRAELNPNANTYCSTCSLRAVVYRYVVTTDDSLFLLREKQEGRPLGCLFMSATRLRPVEILRTNHPKILTLYLLEDTRSTRVHCRHYQRFGTEVPFCTNTVHPGIRHPRPSSSPANNAWGPGHFVHLRAARVTAREMMIRTTRANSTMTGSERRSLLTSTKHVWRFSSDICCWQGRRFA